MSRILDRLQEAEEQRQRLVAERRRLEADADAALAAHDRESLRLPPRADAPRAAVPASPPARRSRSAAWGWVAALACLAVTAFLLLERGQVPRRPAEALPAPAAALPASGLKLDRDLDAFTARLRNTEKP